MDRLLELLRERSFQRRPVVLASGRKSDFFIDCKQTVLLAEGHALVGEAMYHATRKLCPAAHAVAGVELGGCPLASAVAQTSFVKGEPMDAIYVRKEAKNHGSRRLLEGDGHLEPGAKVVVLEDVVTTGGSTLNAVQKLVDGGLSVQGVVILVDRQEGGVEQLEKTGLTTVAVYRKSDFMAE